MRWGRDFLVLVPSVTPIHHSTAVLIEPPLCRETLVSSVKKDWQKSFPSLEAGESKLNNREHLTWGGAAAATRRGNFFLARIAWGPNEAPLKPLGPWQHCRIERFKGEPQWVSHYTEKRSSLGQHMGVNPVYTRGKLSQIALNQPQARLYLPFFN